MNQIWLEVADTVTKDYKGVNIAKFDCSIFKPICDGLGVQKYPSIVWMKNGKITKEYTGILDEELLKSFVFDIMTNTDNSDLSDNIDINKKPSENDDGMDMNKIENSIEKIEDYDPEQDFDNQVVLDPPESVKPDSSPGIKEINNLDISSKDKTDSNLNEEIILDDEIKNGEVQNNQEDNMSEAGLDEIVPKVDDNVGAENDARENEAETDLNVELGDGDLNLDAKTIEVANDDYELQPEVGKADQPENVIEISIQSSSDTDGVLPQAKVPSFDVRAQNNAVQPDDQAVLKVPQIVPVSNFVTRKVVAPSNFTFKPRLVQTQQAVVNLVESSEQELFGEQKVESDSKASNSSSYSEEDDDNEYDDEDEKNNFDINKIVQELPLLPESKEIDSSSEPARIESLEASSDSEEESNENKSPEVEEQVGGTKVLDIAEMITDAKDDFFVEFTAKSFPRKVNKDGVTMLLMYADWCESCDKIRNTMIKLAHKHNKNSKILLGQIDCMKKRNEEFCLSQQMQGLIIKMQKF